jgi:glycosyltransferase involved in cell wall biosynthesis
MPPDTQLLLPQAEDPREPEITILIPALNEALTIGTFVDWCLQGLKEAGVSGEVLIVDSSTDDTAEIALAKGARVLKAPKRGLGRAYIDGLPFARGTFLILGDCDCTYDFREIKPFVDAFHGGAEYVMGSRFRGQIEPGAMPAMHRYFGTPVTTAILNFIYGSRFTDIHCGMRGLTLEAFKRMHLQSQGWEYASELVLKAVKMRMIIREVPIRFHKDPQGRLSHHKRSGFLSPWIAGWDNLRAMFLYGPEFFLLRPGLALFALGLLISLPPAISFGPFSLGPVTLSLYWMLLGIGLALVGLQCAYLGILSKCISDLVGGQLPRWTKRITYNRGVLAGMALVVAGALLCLPLAVEYVRLHLSLPLEIGPPAYMALSGLFLMISGFLTFSFTLVLHSLALFKSRADSMAQADHG